MKPSAVLPLLLLSLIPLAGCKGSREKDVVGTWSTAKGQQVTLDENHGAHSVIGRIVAEGTWSVSGDEVTLVPKTINGKAVGELKASIASRLATLPVQTRQVIEDLDKPNVFLLSADGKSMTTDKSKDRTSGPAETITKKGP